MLPGTRCLIRVSTVWYIINFQNLNGIETYYPKTLTFEIDSSNDNDGKIHIGMNELSILSAHAPVNGGPVFPGTILGYYGLIKHFLAELLQFSTILYIILAI